MDCSLYIAKGPSLLGLDVFQALGLKIESKGIHIVQMDSIQELLQEFAHLFEGIGCAKGFQHCCELLPNAVPTIHKVRLVPFAHNEELAQEIDTLLN